MPEETTTALNAAKAIAALDVLIANIEGQLEGLRRAREIAVREQAAAPAPEGQ